MTEKNSLVQLGVVLEMIKLEPWVYKLSIYTT